MKNKHGVLVFVIALAVSFLTMTGSVKAITIDSFDTTLQSTSANSLSFPTSVTMAAPEAIGGSRKLEILSVVGPLNSTLAVIPIPVDAHGVLSLSNDVGTSSTALVTWDAFGAGLGGVDLTAGGADSIGIALIAIDVGTVDLTVSITDTGGDIASKLLAGVGIGQNVFDFNTFTNFASVSFDLVNKISLAVTTIVPASDLSIDFFETLENPVIPEPATIGLLGIGLAGLGSVYLRRRFRRPKKTTV